MLKKKSLRLSLDYNGLMRHRATVVYNVAFIVSRDERQFMDFFPRPFAKIGLCTP